MASLKERISEDVKQAMRDKERDKLGALRLITAAIKQREVDERITIDDAGVLAILDKMVKQRRDSIDQFRKAERHDLAEKEEFELGIIGIYMPEPLSDDELQAMIEQAIQATGASGMRDMGKVMSSLRDQVQGRADMSQVSAAVKAKLNT